MGGVGGDNDSKKGNKTKQKNVYTTKFPPCVCVCAAIWEQVVCVWLLYNHNII